MPIMPYSSVVTPPSTPAGIVLITAPNFGHRLRISGEGGGAPVGGGGVHLGGGHHADVLAVGGGAGAAAEAGDAWCPGRRP